MYELKLFDGRVVTWEGKDGLDACNRYAQAHPRAIVIAWRTPPHGLAIGVHPRNVIG